VYKRDYAFGMNVMEEIFEIRSCIEILRQERPGGLENTLNDIPYNLTTSYAGKQPMFSHTMIT